MRLRLNKLLGHNGYLSGAGLIPNGCVTQGTNGTKYGYDSSVPIGANTPDSLPGGQAIYANYWLSDGTFIMQFGDLGNEPIPDVEFIFTVINGTLLQYVWQTDTLLYEANNLTLATQLITDYVEDEDVCYTSLPLLQKFISYDMNITDVEGTNTLINNTSYAPHFNAPVINATQNGPGSILVDATTSISTGFKPNIARYSIDETISGQLLTLGPEELLNGDFENGDTNWQLSGGFAVVGAELVNTDGTGNAITRDNDFNFLAGEELVFTFEVIEYTSGALHARVGNLSLQACGISGPGNYSITETASGSYDFVSFVNISGFIGIIDNCSCKRVTIEQRKERRLLTHTDAALGVQEVANGDFDGDSAWSVTAAAVDISGGIANFNGTVGNLTQTLDGVIENDEYLLSITTSGTYAGNGLTLRFGNLASTIANIDADGTHTAMVPATGTEGIRLRVTSANDFIGTVDNVSVRSTKEENKYYIDGLEQAVTPALPDPAVTINLGNTAVIGYPDTIESREADFNVHTEILTPTLEPVGQNLYPNFNMQNGSDIVQDVPTGTLPDGHVLAFNTANPCDAFYTTPDNIEYWYLFNMNHDPVRLVLQQTVGYGIFEVGKRYRYQARVRTLTDTPRGEELRAIHIAAAVELTIVDNDNAMIGENEDYTLRWIDFEVTDSSVGRANFRHGVGVWDVLPTAQDTRDIAIYELGLSNDEIQITHNGEDVVHEREPVIE